MTVQQRILSELRGAVLAWAVVSMLNVAALATAVATGDAVWAAVHTLGGLLSVRFAFTAWALRAELKEVSR